MGMPATDQRRWTAAEVRQLNADNPKHWPRYELVGGELLVSSAPGISHDRIIKWFFLALHAYVDREGLGEVCLAPADIELQQGDVNQPDIFAVSSETSDRMRKWVDVKSVLLAVEVLSPSTARHDRTVKRRGYQRGGVPEYWIVDGASRLVERWRPSDERPEILLEQLVWNPAGASAPLTLILPELWTSARLDRDDEAIS